MSSDSLGRYVADLHVHTVLSPCAAVEMIPPLIVRNAISRGIRLIAVTDHNASANVSAVQRAARGTGLTVLPGIELQTREEVHLLCLFDSLEQMAAWQQVVDDHLPQLTNEVTLFGEQFVVDETGDFICREPRLLAVSCDLSLQQAVLGVQQLGGLAIPAHVNRSSFSLFANLGFLPADLPLDALEITRHITPAEFRRKYAHLNLQRGLTVVQNGDVHCLADFLGSTILMLSEPTVVEIRRAFHHRAGRGLTISIPANLTHDT